MNKLTPTRFAAPKRFLADCVAVALSLTALPIWAAPEEEPRVTIAESIKDGENKGAWRIEFSPYTHHFRFNAEHKDVYAIGLERESEDHSLYGLMAFSNSFGQPSAYAYYGRVFNHVWERYDALYLKLTVGLLYGYRAPYDDKVPLNYNGFSPAIIPAVGWRLDKNWSLQMNFLGTAAAMLMVNKKF